MNDLPEVLKAAVKGRVADGFAHNETQAGMCRRIYLPT